MKQTGPDIVIVGATSAIAEQCARLWARQGARSFHLLARDAEKLGMVSDDLRIRQPEATITPVCMNFTDPAHIEQQVCAILAASSPDIVLIAHGTLPDQVACQSSLQETADALQLNGVSPVLFAEAFARRMFERGHGTLAMIGSVAGDRGRRSNYVYGSAKGLVTRYAQGLQHRAAGTGVKIVLIKPGPTDTPMTRHLKQQGARLAPVESVAADIVSAIARGKPIVYVPGKWAIIMMLIRHLPGFVFNRMDI
ncbi:SDR family NAD(P)-dependent oxidoreductase [Pseudohongiella spirulinae]|uniref:Short-chain dehydrogenase n=1 Tax=Pseudohongiella spirulinae TaxID=1249552 RepID=A0A0S2KGM0_9GAMM|nr:SDR family NAD(P)-dependent oxidoreductase [Pseudohongiella spirulinae]ALO47188.1 short-chain dehydrogenase [Pseudohongiella spirulinae]